MPFQDTTFCVFQKQTAKILKMFELARFIFIALEILQLLLSNFRCDCLDFQLNSNRLFSFQNISVNLETANFSTSLMGVFVNCCRKSFSLLILMVMNWAKILRWLKTCFIGFEKFFISTRSMFENSF